MTVRRYRVNSSRRRCATTLLRYSGTSDRRHENEEGRTPKGTYLKGAVAGLVIHRHIPLKVVDVPAASGTTFATLQPDNATGNFTKIVQRLPVKIVLAPCQPAARLLRVGLSVEATIEIP